MQEKNNQYQRLSKSQQILIEMDIKDIVGAFPQICKDPTEVFSLFLEIYEENQLLPVISKQFGRKLGLDMEAMEQRVGEVRAYCIGLLKEEEDCNKKVNAHLTQFLADQSHQLMLLQQELDLEEIRKFKEAD